MTPVTLIVNGVTHTLKIPREAPLLTILRNDLHLNAPKYGCGLGQCGACTVLINGTAARSCVIPVGGATPVPGQPPTTPANPAEGQEILIAVWDDGSVTALHGHVDLGTGLRTALTQIAAEELDVDTTQVSVLMGSTAAAPNQGATIASASIQIHAAPMRQAAAQARAWLIKRAAQHLQTNATDLTVTAGIVHTRSTPTHQISYADLLHGQHI